jgi:hypothetical protein
MAALPLKTPLSFMARLGLLEHVDRMQGYLIVLNTCFSLTPLCSESEIFG